MSIPLHEFQHEISHVESNIVLKQSGECPLMSFLLNFGQAAQAPWYVLDAFQYWGL